MRVVALGSTFYHYFSTRRFSTGASFTLAGTPAIHAYEDGGTTQITAGLTLTADFDSVTGLNQVAIAATTGNGFEAGKVYTLTIGAGTVDSVSVVGTVVGEFRIETAAELAVRAYNETMYPAHVVATTTGNTTGAVNLTDFLDSGAEADDVNGELFAVKYVGGTYDGLLLIVRATDYAVTNQLATVEQLDGGALPEALAAGDMVWRLGKTFYADARKMNGTTVIGAGTSGNKWRA